MQATKFIPLDQSIERMKAEILEDVASGLVPATVQTFSALHDHCDANAYGGFCDDDTSEALVAQYGGRDADGAMPDGMLAHMNDAQDAIGAWIAAGHLKRATYDRPVARGNPITADQARAQLADPNAESVPAAELTMEARAAIANFALEFTPDGAYYLDNLISDAEERAADALEGLDVVLCIEADESSNGEVETLHLGADSFQWFDQ